MLRLFIRFAAICITTILVSSCSSGHGTYLKPEFDGGFVASPLKSTTFELLTSIIDLSLIGEPNYAVGKFEGEPMTLNTEIGLDLSKGSSIPSQNYVAAVQFRTSDGQWKTIAEYKDVLIRAQDDIVKLTFQVEPLIIDPESKELQVAVWESDLISGEPISTTGLTAFNNWTINSFYKEFTAIREFFLVAYEKSYKEFSNDCNEMLDALRDDLAAPHCMRYASTMYNTNIGNYQSFWKSIYELGIPQSLEAEFGKYLRSTQEQYIFMIEKNLAACNQTDSLDSLDETLVLKCLGQYIGDFAEKSKIDDKTTRARDALAEKLIQLGAEDFRLQE